MDKLAGVGGDALVVRMIDLFVKLSPERLEGARRALGEGDLSTVERLTHSLKSSAANVGAVRLRFRAEDAELCANRGESASISALLDELEQEVARVLLDLQAARARHAR